MSTEIEREAATRPHSLSIGIDGVATQVFRVYIKASPEAIWEAITKPEWTERYGYRGSVQFDDLRPGGKYRFIASAEMKAMGMPDVVVDGEVVEADPPRRLVQTWRPLWAEDISAETTRVTYDIEEDDGAVTRLTVTHEADGAPITAAMVGLTDSRLLEGGGGWPMILSDLKSLLETGEPLMS